MARQIDAKRPQKKYCTTTHDLTVCRTDSPLRSCRNLTSPAPPPALASRCHGNRSDIGPAAHTAWRPAHPSL